MLQNNYKYAGMLQESEESAKEKKLGIWSEELPDNSSNNINETKEADDTNESDFVYLIIEFIIIILIIFIIKHTRKKSK